MFQAVVLGVLQGLSELFPVSSLGHTVLFPTLFGWHSVVAAQSDSESFWLAFVVMLHVGSAVGLSDLLLARLGVDHLGVVSHARDASHRDSHRAPGVAHRRGQHPGRRHRAGGSSGPYAWRWPSRRQRRSSSS
jgi:hypothetical protein